MEPRGTIAIALVIGFILIGQPFNTDAADAKEKAKEKPQKGSKEEFDNKFEGYVETVNKLGKSGYIDKDYGALEFEDFVNKSQSYRMYMDKLNWDKASEAQKKEAKKLLDQVEKASESVKSASMSFFRKILRGYWKSVPPFTSYDHKSPLPILDENPKDSNDKGKDGGGNTVLYFTIICVLLAIVAALAVAFCFGVFDGSEEPKPKTKQADESGITPGITPSSITGATPNLPAPTVSVKGSGATPTTAATPLSSTPKFSIPAPPSGTRAK